MDVFCCRFTTTIKTDNHCAGEEHVIKLKCDCSALPATQKLHTFLSHEATSRVMPDTSVRRILCCNNDSEQVTVRQKVGDGQKKHQTDSDTKGEREREREGKQSVGARDTQIERKRERERERCTGFSELRFHAVSLADSEMDVRFYPAPPSSVGSCTLPTDSGLDYYHSNKSRYGAADRGVRLYSSLPMRPNPDGKRLPSTGFDGDNMYMNENNHEFLPPNQPKAQPACLDPCWSMIGQVQPCVTDRKPTDSGRQYLRIVALIKALRRRFVNSQRLGSLHQNPGPAGLNYNSAALV
ncbi:hypothetical protein JOB18_046654 [Solea senegalensis]|uniref:Uncharacterized protein n=1 Tax=Solea senegalensis TaxID=28829 RepID=A0AAV6QT32_SOLSE|nr:hypothetical protein JOB18_046654 [Solea senegalensis]